MYPVILAALVGTFYLATLRDGIGGQTDTAKWQFVGKVLGVPHTTGYPLYVLLSHVFSYLPFGTLAWRINFMSAVFAVAAVVMAQRILRGLLENEILAFGGALLLAAAPMFWTFATEAGVYSLNAFFVSAVIYLLFKWHDARRGPEAGTAGRGYFYAACFVYALSLGNHVTMITLLPAFALFALLTDRRAALRTLLPALLFVALSACLYSLPFISTALPSPYLENRVETFDDLWRLITATGFRERLFAGGLKGFLFVQVRFYCDRFIAQFTVFGFAALAAGFSLLATRHRPKIFFLIAYLFVNLFMALNYYVPPQQQQYQFIPSYVALALIIGFSAGLFRAVMPHLRPATKAALSASCLAALVAMAAHAAAFDLARNAAMQKEAELNDILTDAVVDALPADGVILAYSYQDSMLMFYKMLGEERGREKRWRVMHDTTWKVMKPETEAFDPANPASRYDVEAVERLLNGEDADWSPLVPDEKRPGPRNVFFWHRDKMLLDMAGFLSERADLPGDAREKNVYGGRPVRMYRVTGRLNVPPRIIIERYNAGIEHLRRNEIDYARLDFRALIYLNPGFAEAHFQLGMCYRGMGDIENARREWKMALDLIPDYGPALDQMKKIPPPPGQTSA